MDFLALVQECAPAVHPDTMLSIIKVESAFNPLALHVNNAPQVSPLPTTNEEAIAAATKLKSSGLSFDVGLVQINSTNLDKYGVSIEQAFDPCVNVALGADILTSNYTQTSRTAPDSQSALQRALSMYNTGSQRRGFENGYVQRVLESAKYSVPALTANATLSPEQPIKVKARAPKAPASWDVFGQAAYARYEQRFGPKKESATADSIMVFE